MLKSKLPRLEPEWYRGHAIVFWTHTLEGRATGWLTPVFHAQWRELLLHTSLRYGLSCPIYVLMPDHWHLLWCGVRNASDQCAATRFLRMHLAPALGNARLQHQPHDHVLRDVERERDRFNETCEYVRQNPVRKGLCTTWNNWPYVGALVPGYPDLDGRAPDFYDRFWRIYDRLISCSPARESGDGS